MVEEKKAASAKLQLAKETLHRLDAPAPSHSPVLVPTTSFGTSCNINCSMTCGP